MRGSDLGAAVAYQLAIAHPEAVIGLHTGGTMSWLAHVPDDLSDAERLFVPEAERWRDSEMPTRNSTPPSHNRWPSV